MNRILVLFAHPRFEQSRTNTRLVEAIRTYPEITFHDLYEAYPDFNIDIKEEKRRLLEHDIIIWHHPFYWYNTPPLLKQWIDMVLEFGWAYGPGGEALRDKMIFNAFTSGGPREVYHREGRNRFTVRQFLAPLEQTAVLCHMTYLPPFAVQGTHRLTLDDIAARTDDYRLLLGRLLKGDYDVEELQAFEHMNDWIDHLKRNGT